MRHVNASMKVQFQTVTMLILLIITLSWPIVKSQSLVNVTETTPARALDAMLQDYAYRALIGSKTGVSFNGSVPKNLTGVEISALRLKTGSMFSRGVADYREFKIPIGVIPQPYVERIVLVYQNLGNWSSFYYPLSGYIYLAPVLGLLAYNGSDLLGKNVSELDISCTREAISMDFGLVRHAPDDSTSNPMCVRFDLHGQVSLTNVISGNRCFTFKQGHFSIVVKSETESKSKPKFKPKAIPPSAPVSPSLVVPLLIPPAASAVVKRDNNGGIGSRVWIIACYGLTGCVVLVWLALYIWWECVDKERETSEMEEAAEGGEPLRMTMVGGVRALVAMGTRTKPSLETEHAP